MCVSNAFGVCKSVSNAFGVCVCLCQMHLMFVYVCIKCIWCACGRSTACPRSPSPSRPHELTLSLSTACPHPRPLHRMPSPSPPHALTLALTLSTACSHPLPSSLDRMSSPSPSCLVLIPRPLLHHLDLTPPPSCPRDDFYLTPACPPLPSYSYPHHHALILVLTSPRPFTHVPPVPSYRRTLTRHWGFEIWVKFPVHVQ